jgi:hypothetical protein
MHICSYWIVFYEWSSHVASIAQNLESEGKAVLDCTTLNVVARI